MSTNRHLALLSGTLLAVGVVVAAQPSVGQVTSDRAAALLIYPDILVGTADGLDTIVGLVNTSTDLVTVRCFYVNVNGHCSNSGAACFRGADCPGGQCIPGWRETDFRLRVTGRQPLAWLASEGLLTFCSPNQTSGETCIPLNGTSRSGPNGQSNAGSRVPPVSDDPFVGQLTCVAVNERDEPVDRNVLLGSVTTVQAFDAFVDVTRHDAVGIPAFEGANNGDNTLVLGEEYAACSETLIMDHFFDGAVDPTTGGEILGALSLIPCSQDFVLQDQNLTSVVAQFLVFNEFEQRFSTSTRVQCYLSLPLSSIDTGQPTGSIFHVSVAGTLTGQTRIKGVGSAGQGLIGTYFDLHGDASSSANLHLQGISSQADIIRLP